MEGSLLDTALRLAGLGTPEQQQQQQQRALDAIEELPPAFRAIAHALGPMLVYAGDEPLARLEWVDAVDVR